MMRTWKPALITALAAAGCSFGAPAASRAQAQHGAAEHHPAALGRRCPPQEAIQQALTQASSLMEQAQYREAAETLRPLASSDCDPRVSLLRAAAVEAGGDASGAAQILAHAHLAWPGNNSIAASLAREYFNSGQQEKAAEALERFQPVAGTPLQEMELAATVEMSTQRLVRAQRIAESAWRSYPSAHTLMLLANTLQLQGRYPDVNRLLAPKRSTYGDSPDFLITLAESEYDAGLYQAARQDISRAISLDGTKYQAHYILANTLVKLGDLTAAVAEYRQAIALAPGQPRTYYQLALALRAQQNQSEEEKVLGQLLEIDRRYAPAHCELGRILMSEHRLEDAVTHLNTAVEDDPSSEEGYYLLARAYAGLGEKDKSQLAVQRLMAVRKANRASVENNGRPAAVHSAGP